MKHIILREIVLVERETVSSLRKKLAAKSREECVIALTPFNAQVMLNNFRVNRASIEADICKFVKLFLTDQFHSTSCLHSDQKGRTANGAHRLAAQIRAGRTQEYRIHVGLTDREVKELDGARQRKPKDILLISEDRRDIEIVQRSPTRARTLAGTLQSIYPLLTNERNYDEPEGKALLRYFYPDLKWALDEMATRLLDRLPVRVAGVFACHYARNNDQMDDLATAVACLKTGEGLRGRLLNYREYLHFLHSGRKVRGSTAKDPYEAVLNKSLRVWQLYFMGQNEVGSKTKLQMVSNLSAMLNWFLGVPKEEIVHSLGLHPTRVLLKTLRTEEEGDGVAVEV